MDFLSFLTLMAYSLGTVALIALYFINKAEEEQKSKG